MLICKLTGSIIKFWSACPRRGFEHPSEYKLACNLALIQRQSGVWPLFGPWSYLETYLHFRAKDELGECRSRGIGQYCVTRGWFSPVTEEEKALIKGYLISTR